MAYKQQHVGTAQGLISELEMCDRKSGNYETWLRRCGYLLKGVYKLDNVKEGKYVRSDGTYSNGLSCALLYLYVF